MTTVDEMLEEHKVEIVELSKLRDALMAFRSTTLRPHLQDAYMEICAEIARLELEIKAVPMLRQSLKDERARRDAEKLEKIRRQSKELYGLNACNAYVDVRNDETWIVTDDENY